MKLTLILSNITFVIFALLHLGVASVRFKIPAEKNVDLMKFHLNMENGDPENAASQLVEDITEIETDGHPTRMEVQKLFVIMKKSLHLVQKLQDEIIILKSNAPETSKMLKQEIDGNALHGSNRALKSSVSEAGQDVEKLKSTVQKLIEDVKGINRQLKNRPDIVQFEELKDDNLATLKALNSTDERILKELKELKEKQVTMENKNEEWKADQGNRFHDNKNQVDIAMKNEREIMEKRMSESERKYVLQTEKMEKIIFDLQHEVNSLKTKTEKTDEKLTNADQEIIGQIQDINIALNNRPKRFDVQQVALDLETDIKHHVATMIKKERETTDGQIWDTKTEMDAKLENSIAKIEYCCTKIDKANIVMGSKIFDLETKLPELIGHIVSKHLAIKKIIGFSAVRQPAYGNSCGDHTVTYTSATSNTDNMLSLSTGVFTVSRPGIYLLSFQAMSAYDSKQTGVHMLKKSITNSALLATDVQKGPSPMSMLSLVKLNKNDQVSVWFWSESPTRGCLYSGINNQTVVTTFSAILMDDAVN